MRTLTSPRRLFLSLALLLGAGCGQAAQSDAPAPDVLVVGSQSTIAVARALGTIDALLGLDTLSTTDSPATAVTKANDKALSLFGGCASISILGGPLTIDFGAGCTLSNGTTLAGKIAIKIGFVNGKVQITTTFDGFALDGLPLDGTVTILLTTLTHYDVTLDLDSDGLPIGGNLALVLGGGAVAIDGQIQTDVGPIVLTISLAGVGFNFSDCYPGAGTVTLGETANAEVIHFDATTATTGTFSLTGPLYGTLTLPAYGECPK